METGRVAGSLTLPAGPDSLCFNKDEFMKDDFDVDHFVSECRKHVQLETLRDDLELYYKLLKTAMIELINKDYADFVNLSTNLVGMDKALNQLTVPLGQLREEVMSLRRMVSEGIQAIDDRLVKEDDIRKKKYRIQSSNDHQSPFPSQYAAIKLRCEMCVLRLLQVIRSVEKIEKILHSQSSNDASPLEASGPPLAGQMLERIGTEFNQLHFHAVQSKGMPLLDKVRPRIAGITAMLQQSLEGLLLEGLQTANVEIVRPCLRTYATIDKTRDAEALIGQVLVKPYVEEVISEQYVQSGTSGLREMYGKLLDFIPNHCRLLQVVTGGAVIGDKTEVIPGYDFTVNSVWPEMVRGLEEKVPSLFNPGNPDMFHEKYTITTEFIRRFELQCASQASVKRLRSHSAYKSFNNKWSLPVYYQIRFKEIAGDLEATMSEGLKEAPDGSEFRLLVTYVLWQNLLKCWADHIYLPPLAHRFWKLTLQLVARYSKWVDELKVASPSKDLTQDGLKSLTANSNNTLTSPNGSNEDQGNGLTADVKVVPPLSVSQLVYVVSDLDRVREQLPDLLELIKPRLENIGFTNFSLISEALADSRASVVSNLPTLSDRIIEELSEACYGYLKNASEVPRLYRRTNKEVPVKASLYVENALKPLHNLQSQYSSVVKENRIQEWLSGALRVSTERYYETISDVLSSVKKMEESLKRLKQARKSAAASNAGTNSGMSDDNKIRLQLALDVEYLWNQVQSLGLQMSTFTQFAALLELAQAAKAMATVEPI